MKGAITTTKMKGAKERSKLKTIRTTDVNASAILP